MRNQWAAAAAIAAMAAFSSATAQRFGDVAPCVFDRLTVCTPVGADAYVFGMASDLDCDPTLGPIEIYYRAGAEGGGEIEVSTHGGLRGTQFETWIANDLRFAFDGAQYILESNFRDQDEPRLIVIREAVAGPQSEAAVDAFLEIWAGTCPTDR